MLERVWRKGNPFTLLVGVQISIAYGEQCGDSLKKLETELTYDPKIILQSIHNHMPSNSGHTHQGNQI